MAASEIRSSARVAPRSVSVEAATSVTTSPTDAASLSTAPGARHVADGAVAHPAGGHGLAGARLRHRADGQQHAVALEHLALVGVVEAGQLDALALDVAPDVELGPVRQREDPHVLADAVPRVEDVPQLGALVLGVPLAEVVAQADHALLGPGLLLVAPAAAEHPVEAVHRDGLEQRLGLQRVAGAVGPLAQPAVVDPVLHRGDLEPQPEPLDGGVAVGEHLGEVVAGVDVQHRERDRGRPERLCRDVQHDDGVLAAAEQQHRPLELGGDLADDEHRLALEHVELAQRRQGGGRRRGRVGGHVGRHGQRLGQGVGGGGHAGCSPHSVLAKPAQRPARGSSPGATRWVQGSQPIDG